MGRHIIAALESMLVIGLVLRNQVIEETLEVPSDRAVSIFVDGQAGTGVLDEYMRQPDREVLQLGQL